jgi:hypothetical protein
MAASEHELYVLLILTCHILQININYSENVHCVSTGDYQPNVNDETLGNPLEKIAQVWPMAPFEDYISVLVCPPCHE